jgi:outer membrane immunogenic protein
VKKPTIGTLAILALIGTPAWAADMATKAPPPVRAPAVYDWTGFYGGLNAGGAWGQDAQSLVLTGSWVGIPETPGLQAAGSQGLDPFGFAGGGQAGYNFQRGPAVLGLEVDFDYLDLKAGRNIPNVPVAGANSYAFTATDGSKWMATVRGRLGYAVDRLLLYFTAGLAVANHNFSQTITQLNFPFFETGSASTTKDALIVGGGLEYALTNGWSVKGEYLYTDLGQVSATSIGNCPTLAPGACSGFTGIHSDKLRIEIARAGINYKFGTP